MTNANTTASDHEWEQISAALKEECGTDFDNDGFYRLLWTALKSIPEMGRCHPDVLNEIGWTRTEK